MASKRDIRKWKLYKRKSKLLTMWGLMHGYVFPYDNELIMKLRDINYGGIPASIILLSDGMSNGHCYDRATLMSQAFLDTEDDVNLIYASVDGIKLNPKYLKDADEDPMYADHCIVERITKDGRHYIYDTTDGFIYDKRLYWLIERPKVRAINNKQKIIDFVKLEQELNGSSFERDKYVSMLVLPLIERTYNRPTEMYSQLGIELLQREIEEYKKRINYDGMVRKREEDMARRSSQRK